MTKISSTDSIGDRQIIAGQLNYVAGILGIGDLESGLLGASGH
ncbi:hypothetical protein BFV94_4611 [Alteromonas macleodii]|uniref:Uncharacterized protein n=1 Tax=Alteromonas macleodii TaxID=28108 RepID=A0AB36FRT0_ALTMA|nr:hypothetical protein BFV95_4621 [Alteromonas macleodii]OES25140.1 hypothetical protein BFV94_4611 [Alteromonas macleodii]